MVDKKAVLDVFYRLESDSSYSLKLDIVPDVVVNDSTFDGALKKLFDHIELSGGEEVSLFIKGRF